jgi:hypothetical protein
MEENNLSQVNSIDLPNLAPEILPISQAIIALAPNTVWSLEGFEYSGLKWNDDPSKKPSESAVMAKARELYKSNIFRLLRKERDARMKEVDWVILRSVRTGEPISQEWKDYMQALADITNNATPYVDGRKVGGVIWPTRPDGVDLTDPYR